MRLPDRIVHYYPMARKDASGVTVALSAWADAAASAGYQVVIADCGPADSGELLRTTAVEHVQVRHVGSHRQTKLPVGLGKALRAGDLLVLHEGWVTANLYAGEVARRMRIPYVVVPHGVYEPGIMRDLRRPVSARYRAEARLLSCAAAVHVFFESERELVKRIAPLAKIIVAPTGCQVPDVGWVGGGAYISWLGRLDPTHKGLDLLLEAMASLPAGSRPRLRIHGYDYRGGLRTLEDMRVQLGLEASVMIGGPLYGDAKIDFLRRSMLYVHPSRWECHSIALLENLALGVPVVVTETMHIAASLRPYLHSAVVSADPTSIGESLASGYGSAALGAAGRNYVREELAWDRIMASWSAQVSQVDVRNSR